MSIHHQGIQSLSFNFENCDDANIRTSFIGLFDIHNIQTSLGKIHCSNSKDIQIDFHKSCEAFVISLYRSYNKVWSNGGGIDQANHYDDLFERLKSNDIVSLTVKKSNVTEIIHLPYDGEYNNKNQTTLQNKFGDLFIFVEKNKNFFNMYSDIMNDEYYVKNMFSIEELEKYSKAFDR